MDQIQLIAFICRIGNILFGLEDIPNKLSYLLDIKKHHVIPPSCLRIFFLGDIIEGSTIYKGQKRALDLITIDQVSQGVEYFSQFIYELAKHFPKVKCYGVPGNHGRIGDKGENWMMDNLCL